MTSIATDTDDTNESAYKGQPSLLLLPIRQTKKIHLIRHGEGFHNVAGHANHDNYKSEEWFDSHLTEEGWRQALALNKHIQECDLKVDLVVVSPLMRALETAVGAFGRCGSKDSGDSKPLMLAQSASEQHRAARPEVSVMGSPPFIAQELCREIIGVHPCDRRRPTSVSQSLFPGMDWSLLSSEEDILWRADHRETKEEIVERAREFLRFIMRRPESSIAIVTHSTFLHFLCQSFGHDYSTHIQGELHRWYENCEMRSLVLADTHELHVPDRNHFKGGHSC